MPGDRQAQRLSLANLSTEYHSSSRNSNQEQDEQHPNMPKLTPEQTRFLNTDNGFDCFFNSIIQTKGTDALITGTNECKTRSEKE